jgi:mycothiol system anti-sigma-R factor
MSDAHDPRYNCREVATRLFPYLDRELNPEEQAAVRAHLDRCGPCADHFRFEANVLTFLGKRLAHTQAPPELRARISRLCLHDRRQ